MKEWFSPAELAAMTLPGLPPERTGVAHLARKQRWAQRINLAGEALGRRRAGAGGGYEYHYTVLPHRALTALVARAKAEERGPSQDGAGVATRNRGELWAWFETLPDARKAKARERMDALDTVNKLIKGGLAKNVAVHTVARERKIGPSTLYSWFDLVAGLPAADWLPALAPRHVGRKTSAECSPEAWDALLADYLRNEQPPFQACYDRIEEIAKARGWQMPAARTLLRRVEAEIPDALAVYMREGEAALRKLYPWQERDRSSFHALEAVNADWHTVDVRVLWPDGSIDRPLVIVVQDLYSNKILAWRVDLNPTATGVRLCFLDVFREFGIPRLAFLDNGREFASKLITGGQKTRYRFKVTPSEMDGVLTALNVEVHWTTPYSGQSKPVERSFREAVQRIWTHPAFAGAYTGSQPEKKPANYGERAVPFDEFLSVLDAGIKAYNARPNRRTRVCGGVKSFDAAFQESYERALITRATPEQLRMAMLSAEQVTCRTPNGSVHVLGGRYWSEFLTAHIGQKVTVRFDPDDLAAPVHVYRADGPYLGAAECWEASEFLNAEDARQHNRNRRAYMKAVKAAAALEVKLRPADIAAMIPDDPDLPAPEAKLIRMVAGNTVLAPRVADADPDEAGPIDFDARFRAGLRVLEGGRGLCVD